MKAKLKLSFYNGNSGNVVAILTIDGCPHRVLATYSGASVTEVMEQNVPLRDLNWRSRVPKDFAFRSMVAANVNLVGVKSVIHDDFLNELAQCFETLSDAVIAPGVGGHLTIFCSGVQADFRLLQAMWLWGLKSVNEVSLPSDDMLKGIAGSAESHKGEEA